MSSCKECLHYDVCVKTCMPGLYDLNESEGCKEHFQSRADFAEIHHGEWLKSEDDGYVYCSCCRYGAEFDGHSWILSSWCPNCGSRMNHSHEPAIGFELTDRERKILCVFAECSMNVAGVSKQLYYHRNTVVYHLKHIHKKYGLNPFYFFDLCKLMDQVKRSEELKREDDCHLKENHTDSVQTEESVCADRTESEEM